MHALKLLLAYQSSINKDILKIFRVTSLTRPHILCKFWPHICCHSFLLVIVWSAYFSTQRFTNCGTEFYVHGSMRHESMSIIVQQDATMYSLLYFCKLLYMFRVVTPPIIRSTYDCNHNIWHWSNCLCYLLLSRSSWNWWWVELPQLPPETCRAVYRNIANCT